MIRNYPCWLVVFCCVATFSLHGQEIKGTVRDAATNKALPFANVFLNNTTIGAVTDTTGTFTLKNISQPGTFELVVSFVGYEPFKADIVLKSGETLLANVNLIPSEIELSNVEVRSTRDEAWEKKRKRFERIFLGDDELAKACRIANPWVIDFPEEKIIDKFIAKASGPIDVENFALGYKLQFYMNAFAADRTSYFISGNVKFEELYTPDDQERKAWRTNRQRAYQHSSHHLFKAIIDHRIMGEGFKLYTERPGFENALMRSSNFSADLRQTLMAVDTSALVTPLANETYLITMKNRLEVHYVREKARVRLYRDVPNPVSWIKLSRGSVIVNKEGYELNPAEVTVSGAMTEDRVASMLPLDYHPSRVETAVKEDHLITDEQLEPFREQIYVHMDKPYYYPGEQIWLKGYMNYSQPALRDSLSRTAYVEVIHPSRKILMTKTVLIDNGVFYGDFLLPDTLTHGTYCLRAYTSFSRNFGDDKLYTKAIPLLDLRERPDPVQQSKTGCDSTLVIKADKKKYKQRDKITLVFNSKDGDGAPITANLSVTVTDARMVVPVETSQTIIDGFPMKHYPVKSEKTGTRFPVEFGVGFSGTFFAKKNNPEKATLHVLQFSPQNFTMTQSDEHGKFSVSGLMFYDTASFSIQARSERGVNYGRVEIAAPSRPSAQIAMPVSSLKVISTEGSQRLKSEYQLPADSKMLDAVVVESTPFEDYRVRRPYGAPSYILTAKDINTGYGNLLLTLPGKFPGLVVRMAYNQDEDPHWVVYLQRMVSIANAAEVIVTVNDNFTAGRPADILAAIDPATVESIELKTGVNVLYGSYGGNGILAVYTKTGAVGAIVKDKKGIPVVRITGYSKPSEFKAPSYRNPNVVMASADYRSTLYWNPSVTTDSKGTASVSFYASDLTGRYHIVAEGITDEGKPVRFSGFIEVEER